MPAANATLHFRFCGYSVFNKTVSPTLCTAGIATWVHRKSSRLVDTECEIADRRVRRRDVRAASSASRCTRSLGSLLRLRGCTLGDWILAVLTAGLPLHHSPSSQTWITATPFVPPYIHNQHHATPFTTASLCRTACSLLRCPSRYLANCAVLALAGRRRQRDR